MKTAISSALIMGASALHPAGFKFMQYLSKHGKSYGTLDEFNLRLQNFANIDAFIEEWNSNEAKTSTVGHNFLSDWTTEEKKGLNGSREEPADESVPTHQTDENQSIPTSLNWVSAGHVTEVLD